MSGLVRVCGCALILVAVSAVIRSYRPELGAGVACAGGLALLLYGAVLLSPAFDFIKETASAYSGAEYGGILLRSLAAALIAQFAADVCRDCGEGALASKVEFCGKAAIAAMGTPLLKALLECASGLMER